MGSDGAGVRCANLSTTARRYLDDLGANVEDLFYHVLATLHDPAYRAANAGALRMEWPRIPLPGSGDRESKGAAAALASSAARGRELARLLDPETPVPGVTDGRVASWNSHHRRAGDRGRPQHDRRGLRGNGRMGPFWVW